MQLSFGYPTWHDNTKILTQMEGPYSDAMMNITVYQLQAGETRTFAPTGEEQAVLLIQGSITFVWNNHSRTVVRNSMFTDEPYCLHVCHDVSITITAQQTSEILVQSTPNPKDFTDTFYEKGNFRDEVLSVNELDGKMLRRVRTFFDVSNEPDSLLVCGEIITPQGGWSSYPPHSHPQPEVYYYRFDKPQGFGACFMGDEVRKITNGSFCSITKNETHPQVTAPGYSMYYVWMIRNWENDPWVSRNYDEDHTWILNK